MRSIIWKVVTPDPKSGASANSATLALEPIVCLHTSWCKQIKGTLEGTETQLRHSYRSIQLRRFSHFADPAFEHYCTAAVRDLPLPQHNLGYRGRPILLVFWIYDGRQFGEPQLTSTAGPAKFMQSSASPSRTPSFACPLSRSSRVPSPPRFPHPSWS